MANETVTRETLLATLKRHCPAKVRAWSGDDDSREISVPSRRKKWTQVIEAIEGRSWTRVELLDKSGAVIAYVDNTEPARELEDLEGSGRISKTRADMEWMANVILRGQREVLTFRDAEHSALLRAQGDVLREMSSAVHSLGAIYRAQVDATRESAEVKAQAAAAAAAGGGDFKELMEALPQILQMLPVLKSLVAGGGTSTSTQQKPKNGA